MTSGLIERISRHSRAMIESDYLLDQDREFPLLVASYDLLSRICTHLNQRNNNFSSPNNNQSLDGSSVASGETTESNNPVVSSEPSSAQAHLLSLLSSTEAAGVVGALYVVIAVANQKNPGGASSPTPSGPSNAAKNLICKGLRLLRNLAELDLPKLQVRKFLTFSMFIQKMYITNDNAHFQVIKLFSSCYN